MPVPISVVNLIEDKIVEQNRIEYKEGWDPEPIMHTVCAFANDYEGYCGGYVIIGVNASNGIPKTPIAGLPKERLDVIQNEIVEYCRKCLSPSYLPTIEVASYKGADIVVLWCPNGYEAPYYCKEHVYAKGAKERKCYIRKGSSTLPASPGELKELQRSAEIVPFDDRANFKAEIGDLKPGLVMDFLTEIKSDLINAYDERGAVGLYESLQLLAGPKESLHPKNAALLLFSLEPERFLPYSYIVVDYIPDPAGDGLETKTFQGPVQKQLSDALSYIRNLYIRTRIRKIPGQAESVTVENYPYAAIEELLPNAVLHKDYQIPEPITVRITADRMEITSFPGISPTISDENINELRMISRSYRNKRLASFLRDMGLIEAKNTGIPKAQRALVRNGSPSLRFEMGPEREYVTAVIDIHPDFLAPLEARPLPNVEGTVSSRIVSFLADNPNSTETEIARGLGHQRVSNSVHKALMELLSQGKAVKDGKKYRLP